MSIWGRLLIGTSDESLVAKEAACRRLLFTLIPASAFGLGTGGISSAQRIRLADSDKRAISLGYVRDALGVDAKKQVTFTQGHFCSNSQHFAGDAEDSSTPCAVVGGKQVNAKGCCIVWVKKTSRLERTSMASANGHPSSLRHRFGIGVFAAGLVLVAWLPLGVFGVVPFAFVLPGETALRAHASAAIACLLVAAWALWRR